MNKDSGCLYGRPWQGRCGAVVVEGETRCAEHLRNCVECGYPAVRGCENAGSLVCGSPLCEVCTHLVHIGYNDSWYENRVKQLDKQYADDVLEAMEIRDESRAHYAEVKAANRPHIDTEVKEDNCVGLVTDDGIYIERLDGRVRLTTIGPIYDFSPEDIEGIRSYIERNDIRAYLSRDGSLDNNQLSQLRNLYKKEILFVIDRDGGKSLL